ncbi:type II toxin-antitoxin system RelE/ParE family toxin [Patescibacteria group bacterium]|nr:type II toxin-antitoxin system RelE/ParE family toxin [Patescibacteria group bacterium]
MIYNNSKYKVKFYKNTKTDGNPVLEYIEKLSVKEKAKVLKYIEFLRENKGYLDEPYSKHIKGKIRELRIDFTKNRHRILYFTFIKRNIILLHVFLKRTSKVPQSEIKRAEENYHNVLENKELYE